MTSARIVLSRMPATNNYYLDFEDEDGSPLSYVKVIKDGSICEETFLAKMIEAVDKVYETAGLESPSAKLYHDADEQRIQAIKDVQTCLMIIDKAYSEGYFTQEWLNLAMNIKSKWNPENGTMINYKGVARD